ncbi:hypothetical protein ACLOJK_039315 [Asimina triloba]
MLTGLGVSILAVPLLGGLESALKASEAAQASLHAERANARVAMFTDEEFNSLKLQVTEINLLRESNMQLREENKHNFEECQKFREVAQKAKMESEHSSSVLREKETELDVCRKELERKNAELEHLEHRITELLERSRSVDPEEYSRMKANFEQIQLKMRELEAEAEEANKLVSEKQERASFLEQSLASCQLELDDMQKKNSHFHQNEINLKSENEKQKRLVSQLKRKIEILAKEKDELNREKQVLLKQIEEYKSGRMHPVESANEQAIKEKDTRIQVDASILERILEKEREELRKEKSKRQKTESTVASSLRTVIQEKKKVYEELEKHRLAKDNLLEFFCNDAQSTKISGIQVPSETSLEDQTAAYFLAVNKFEGAAHSALDSGLGSHPNTAELTLAAEMSQAATAGHQPPTQPTSVKSPSLDQSATPQAAEVEKIASAPKLQTETRRPGRKLVRPPLEQPPEASGDVEVSEIQRSSMLTEGKREPSQSDPEPQGVVSLPPVHAARKRLASFLTSDSGVEVLNQQESCSGVAPLMKKPKGSPSRQEGDEETIHPQDFEKPQTLEEQQDIIEDAVPGTNEAVVAAKDEEMDTMKELEVLNKDSVQNEPRVLAEELLEKPREASDIFGQLQAGEANDDQQQLTGEAENEREEGELEPDVSQPEDGADMPVLMDVGPEDSQGEAVDAAPDIDIDGVAMYMGDPVVEIPSPSEVLENDEKKVGAEMVEDVAAEGSDRSSNNTGNEPAVESNQSPEAASGAAREGQLNVVTESEITRQSSTSVTPETVTEGRESLGRRSSTTIDLTERARVRSQQRQAGLLSPAPTRGRGRLAGNLLCILRPENLKGIVRVDGGFVVEEVDEAFERNIVESKNTFGNRRAKGCLLSVL